LFIVIELSFILFKKLATNLFFLDIELFNILTFEIFLKILKFLITELSILRFSTSNKIKLPIVELTISTLLQVKKTKNPIFDSLSIQIFKNNLKKNFFRKLFGMTEIKRDKKFLIVNK